MKTNCYAVHAATLLPNMLMLKAHRKINERPTTIRPMRRRRRI